MAKRKAWHREDIKAELRKRHGSLKALAHSWGYNPAAITHALIAPQLRRPCARLIAEALGLAPGQIWPEVFGTEPEVGPVSLGRHPNRAAVTPDSQKKEAA